MMVLGLASTSAQASTATASLLIKFMREGLLTTPDLYTKVRQCFFCLSVILLSSLSSRFHIKFSSSCAVVVAATGDRIMYLGISFEHISFEDALTILSYASPYLVNMELRAPIGSPVLVHAKADSKLDRNIVRAEAPPSCGKLVFHPRWKSRSQENLVSMNYITANGGQIDPAVADDVNVKWKRTRSDWRGRIKPQLLTREDNERMVKEWQRQESLVTQVSPNDVIMRASFDTAHAAPSALNNNLVADSNASNAKKDEAVEIIIKEKEVVERVKYNASDNSIHQRQSDSSIVTDENKSLDISNDETDHGLTNGDERDNVRDHIRDLEELSRSKLAQKMKAISASYSWIDNRGSGQRQTHDSRSSRTQQQQLQHERASVMSSFCSTRSSGSLTEPAVAVGDIGDRTVVISSGMLSPAKRRKMNGSSLPDVIDDSEESWRYQLDMAEQLARGESVNCDGLLTDHSLIGSLVIIMLNCRTSKKTQNRLAANQAKSTRRCGIRGRHRFPCD